MLIGVFSYICGIYSDKLLIHPQNNSCCNGATTSSAGDDAVTEIPLKVSKSSGKSSYLLFYSTFFFFKAHGIIGF